MLLVIITIAQTATVSMLLVIIIWSFELDEGNFDAEAFSKDDGYINELDIKKTFDSDSLGTNDEMESGYSGSVCDSDLVRQLDISEFSCYSEEFNCGLLAGTRNSLPEFLLMEKV